MSEKPTDPIELYAWLKQQISTLEKELDDVKDEVFDLVEKDGGQTDRDDFVMKCTKRPKCLKLKTASPLSMAIHNT